MNFIKKIFFLKNYSTIWAHVRMDQRVETVRTALQYGAENCKIKKIKIFIKSKAL